MQFEQIFDTSVGITGEFFLVYATHRLFCSAFIVKSRLNVKPNIIGEAELAEVDGPYVKIRLRGRFWHERSLVLARLGNYLKQRIPVSCVKKTSWFLSK